MSQVMSSYSWVEFPGFGLTCPRLQHINNVHKSLEGSGQANATNYSAILKHVFSVSAKKKAVSYTSWASNRLMGEDVLEACLPKQDLFGDSDLVNC